VQCPEKPSGEEDGLNSLADSMKATFLCRTGFAGARRAPNARKRLVFKGNGPVGASTASPICTARPHFPVISVLGVIPRFPAAASAPFPARALPRAPAAVSAGPSARPPWPRPGGTACPTARRHHGRRERVDGRLGAREGEHGEGDEQFGRGQNGAARRQGKVFHAEEPAEVLPAVIGLTLNRSRRLPGRTPSGSRSDR
jgi:hypothetical protein